MGASHSYVTDLDVFATNVASVDGHADWREYDYVVIGGGTAGCIVASRLSEDRDVTVLLVEAGGDGKKELLTRIPFAWAKLPRTSLDWAFKGAEQSQSNNRTYPIARGKVLGGTSTINALIYQTGSPEDFDQWEKMGAVGFGYKDMIPYLRKTEGFVPSQKHPDCSDHGTGGPWKTSIPNHVEPFHERFIQACSELGVPPNPNLNSSESILGAGMFTSVIDPKTASRNSVADHYLSDEVLRRPNLTVAVGITAEQVVFDQADVERPRAIGALLSKSPRSPKYGVRAKQEVIVSMGAISTPHLLLLSGLGPKNELEKIGAPVVKDLPQVGKNLVDHMSGGAIYTRANPSYSLDYLNNPLFGVKALLRWLIFGDGVMSSMAAPGCAFIRSDDPNIKWDPTPDNYKIRDTTAGPKSPDLEILWFPVITGDLSADPPRGNGVSVGAVVLKSEGSGEITAKTNSIYDHPVIDHKTFESENDWHVAARGVRFCLRLIRTEAMKGVLTPKAHSTDQSDLFWPGDANPDRLTDEELRQYMQAHSLPIFHPTSTARIAPTSETGVLDARLRVHGTTGLRVCDASALPTNVSGHPAAVIAAIAEKAADLIKEDRTLP